MKDFLDLAPNMDILEANSDDLIAISEYMERDANGNCNLC